MCSNFWKAIVIAFLRIYWKEIFKDFIRNTLYILEYSFQVFNTEHIRNI